MAQEPESERNASGIARTSKRKWGYDSEQVDAFLERAHMLYEGEGAQLTQHDIQNVSFDLVKGGYVIAQVDAALARLERAVVDKQTTWEISQHGRVAWKRRPKVCSASLTPIPNVSTANVSSQEKARNRAMTASKWIASSISA